MILPKVFECCALGIGVSIHVCDQGSDHDFELLCCESTVGSQFSRF